MALGVGYLALVTLFSPPERVNLHLMVRMLLGRRRTGRVLGSNHSDALLGTFAAITVPAAALDTQATQKKLATAYQDTGRAADAIPPPEQTLVVRKSRPPDGAAGQKGPADFRRPPAASARQPLPSSVARPPVKLTDHSSTSRKPEPPRKDGQSDREIVAAITAGDPAGIAMAYDRYAEALYGYSHWVLHDSAASTVALKVRSSSPLRCSATCPSPPSSSVAVRTSRNECPRRIRPASAVRYAAPVVAYEPADATAQLDYPIMPFLVIAQPTYSPGRVNGHQGQAELRSLLHSILVALKPREREVIELSFRHDLNYYDLAILLGVSQSRAHDLATRARGRLEEALRALHIALN